MSQHEGGPLPVALIGAGGKMGRFTRELLAGRDDLTLVCELASADDVRARLADCGARVGLDFTVAGLGARHAEWMLEAGVRPLVGTSGVAPEEDARLDELARERGLGGLIVPNFCLGVWLQQRLALEAAKYLAHVEIVEEHSITKVDAPSGTAADTAVQLAGALGREPSEIPIHSVRLPGLYSNQSVHFGSPGEELRIVHRTYGLGAFGPGILASLRYVASADGVGRGVGLAFEFEAARRARG